MNIAIVYASNSGGTYLAAKQIKTALETTHTVTVKKAAEVSPAELLRFDVVLFGSSSWKVEGKEGMPLESMLALLKRIQAHKLAPKRFAVFGCGEETFAYFCGAVDVIDKYLRTQHAKALVAPLRINEYFFRLLESEALIDRWTKNLLSTLNTL